MINDLYRLLKKYSGLRNLIRELKVNTAHVCYGCIAPSMFHAIHLYCDCPQTEYGDSKMYPIIPRYTMLKDMVGFYLQIENIFQYDGVMLIHYFRRSRTSCTTPTTWKYATKWTTEIKRHISAILERPALAFEWSVECDRVTYKTSSNSNHNIINVQFKRTLIQTPPQLCRSTTQPPHHQTRECITLVFFCLALSLYDFSDNF